jgi:choline kinase
MNCVILAAGASSRLRPLTDSMPKCLLHIGGQAIIERAIREVFHAGIMHFIIVTGFQDWKVKNFVMRNFPSLSIDIVFNKDFETTENGYSLFCARAHADNEELLLLDADIMFDEEIVRLLLAATNSNCVAVRTEGEIGDEDVKVAVSKGGEITHIGKAINSQQIYGESVGIEKFSKEGTRILFQTLEERIKSEGGKSEFYEASFQAMIERGTKIHPVNVDALRCIEIDTADDLHRAEKLFSSPS